MPSDETTTDLTPEQRQRLHRFGWADGSHSCICTDCERQHNAARWAIRCRPCAEKAMVKWSGMTEEQRQDHIARNVAIIVDHLESEWLEGWDANAAI